MILRLLGLFAGIMTIGAIGFLVVVAVKKNRSFEAPFPEIKASTDAAVIARGRYLVMGPAHCMTCHSRPEDKARAMAGEEVDLAGGVVFAIPPGQIFASNLTPDPETGIGQRTDGELARVLRHSVGADGRCIVPFMPFQNLSDEDLTAVISYLRSRPAVNHAVPPHDWSLLGDVVRAVVMVPEGPSGTPPKSVTAEATAEYGKYLAHSVANCYGCHTNRDLRTGRFVGAPFAGGMVIQGPTALSPKITVPDITDRGRLGELDEAKFVTRMKSGKPGAVGAEGEMHMPWGSFSNMTDHDLVAIHRYLKTVPASLDPK